MNHVRDCVINVLSKSDRSGENLEIRILGVMADILWWL